MKIKLIDGTEVPIYKDGPNMYSVGLTVEDCDLIDWRTMPTDCSLLQYSEVVEFITPDKEEQLKRCQKYHNYKNAHIV